jgi:hypothetical protein
MNIGKPQAENHRTAVVRRLLCVAALLLGMSLAGGCAYSSSKKVSYVKLATPYDRAELKTSTTLDILNVAQDPAYQFSAKEVEAVPVTQSDTGVAYSGRSQDGRVTWLNLVAFDELRMTTQRKYFFCIDERAVAVPEKPKKLLIPPHQGILFYAAFVIDPEILTTPYATAEAQKIALVRWLAAKFQSDVSALTGSPRDPTQGNKYVEVCALMVRQMFGGIVTELDRSPDFAKNLANEQGVAFPHMSLDEGHIRLLVANDIATMKIRVNLPMIPSE